MARVVRDAIESIDYPNKDRAWEHVQQLGRKHQRRFPGYAFIPRGGLSSPHVKYMTDIDFIFNHPTPGLVAPREYDALSQLAVELCHGEHNIISAKVSYGDDDKFDEETQDLAMVGSIVDEGADLVVITGRYTLRNGWSVPMDFTLQRGKSKMSKAMRVQRICQNVEEGNYAKVVQRVRALLEPEEKRDFAAEWNREGGALRFLAKQLDLLRFMSQREASEYLPYLCIPASPAPEEWATVVTESMQSVALDVLLSKRRLIMRHLGREGERIYDQLETAQHAAP